VVAQGLGDVKIFDHILRTHTVVLDASPVDKSPSVSGDVGADQPKPVSILEKYFPKL
jgi:hypothetical protein